MARKTQAERDREWRREKQLSWEIFKPSLEAATSMEDAERLVLRAPPDTDGGRHWYRNLGFFLHYFKRPPDANHEESQLYIAFIRRLASV